MLSATEANYWQDHDQPLKLLVKKEKNTVHTDKRKYSVSHTSTCVCLHILEGSARDATITGVRQVEELDGQR